MSEEVYQAIATARSGFVEAPAGCGKTEATVRTVATYCSGTQLILTHTHAGVDALRRRFRDHKVPSRNYHVDTIAGWAWGWVRKYPTNAGYAATVDIADWNQIYAAMTTLLQKDFVRLGVLNSYAGVIVDEYQDCTLPMHRLIVALKQLLPCRVLGDDLQGIFGFKSEMLIDWTVMKAEFVNDLGGLRTPHRWKKARNDRLGEWLLGVRDEFRQGGEPNYRGSPIGRRTISYADIGSYLVGLKYGVDERACVIGPKNRRMSRSAESTLVNRGYRVLEANELPSLRELIALLAAPSAAGKADAVIEFLTVSYGGWPTGEQEFLEKLLRGTEQNPRRADRKALCTKSQNGITPELVVDVLAYVGGLPGISCKLRESVSALKCILEGHLEAGTSLKALYAEEITSRKYRSRSSILRCIGSTLLVKGLEFDHVVILRDSNWVDSWGSHKDLYVALTRGSRSVTLVDLVRAPEADT